MAQKVNIQLVDDLDGESPATQSISFSLDGAHYDIDLNDRNAQALAEALAPWIAVARKSGGRRRRGPVARPASDKLPLADIRAWAIKTGHTVSARGRVSAEIVRAYNAAHNTKPEFSS